MGKVIHPPVNKNVNKSSLHRHMIVTGIEDSKAGKKMALIDL